VPGLITLNKQELMSDSTADLLLNADSQPPTILKLL
jgi:hypothetical protein